MTALRWTTLVVACAAIGAVVGHDADFRRTFSAATVASSDGPNSSLAFAEKPALHFTAHGRCKVPTLVEDDTFHGGMTNGDQVTIALDTTLRTFRFQVEAAWHAGQPARLRTGTLYFDEADCTYRLGDEEPIQIAINADGVMFGSIDANGPLPLRLVAFRNVSRDMTDLAGAWRIIGDDGMSTTLQETQIRADGTFSRCSLTHANPLDCVPDTGRITRTSNAFHASERHGHGGILILGRAGQEWTPLLLRPDDPAQGMRFLIRQRDSFSPSRNNAADRPSQQHIRVVAPVFHPG